jgi:DNA-binding CsgD family transcriptional regulator
LDGDENMGEGDPLYRAAHLGLEQWNNIPDSSRIHSSYNDQSDIERGTAYSNVITFLFKFMAEHLTARQFEVIRLYHLEYQLTQNAIAQVLKIAQPTVNQHLNGKKRNGKNVGGAYKKIRRDVSRIANSNDIPAENRQIMHFLMSLGKSDISSAQRNRLLSTNLQ